MYGKQFVRQLCGLGIFALAIAFVLNLFPTAHFTFDILTSFKLQYALVGFLLCVLSILVRDWKYALISGLIALFSGVETRLPLQEPLAFSPATAPPHYRILTFNYKQNIRDLSELRSWLLRPDNAADLVVIQETVLADPALAESLIEKYPFQFHQSWQRPFGMSILSRHPFLSEQRLDIQVPAADNFVIRLQIQPTLEAAPLTLYAFHARQPLQAKSHALRNIELAHIAKLISEDSSRHIAMVGDWNITPFSPAFQHLLEVSGLNYQSYGMFHDPTWPSFNQLSALKIPIDHVLYSDGLLQVTRHVGPALGSDHHPLFVSLAEKKPNEN